MKELNFWKRVLHCYKRAPLFDKRALGQREKGPVEVEFLNRNMFLTHFIQIEIFFQKGHFQRNFSMW